MESSDRLHELEYYTIPKLITAEVMEHLVSSGMIPKKDLIDGQEYFGHCRNALTAIWHEDIQKFIYRRYKFGEVFNEDINHPEDDNGFDLFIPIRAKE